jgi:TRAP-type C4-dicarboxylate transport system permease small subunit
VKKVKLNNKALNTLLNLDLIIAGISVTVLILLTFIGVIMRYFVNNPFTWQEEVQLWCFVWVIFFGASAAFRSGSHVAIDIVVDLLPDSLKKVVDILVYFVVMAVLIYLAIHGSNLVTQLANTGRTTNILDVPYPIIYAAFPIGCVLMMINYTLITGVSLFSKKTKVEGGVQ